MMSQNNSEKNKHWVLFILFLLSIILTILFSIRYANLKWEYPSMQYIDDKYTFDILKNKLQRKADLLHVCIFTSIISSFICLVLLIRITVKRERQDKE